MGLNYYASSPTLVLPPAQPSHYLMHHAHDEIAMTDSYPVSSTKRFTAKYPVPPSINYLATCSHSIAGRKRSRADEDHDGDALASPVSAPVPALSKPRPEPILGPGMTLIYPDEPQPAISPESQSGTWIEDRAAPVVKIEPVRRPIITARKSQRLLSVNDPGSISSAAADVEIDPIVMRLGIGWKRIPQDHASTAGQASCIKDQFSFGDPQILLQHEGLGILVVRTKPASAQGYWDQWWLFTDDLKSCRFLCHEESDLFRRLSNKRQDERGNWQPDILVEGPVVRAKHIVVEAAQPVASNIPPPASAPAVDVEMQG